MKLLTYLVRFLVGFALTTSLLLGIRIADWAQNVATPYMILTSETSRCNRFEAARALNDYAKQHRQPRTAFECPFDEKACDKIDGLRQEYEDRMAGYHKRWSWFSKATSSQPPINSGD